MHSEDEASEEPVGPAVDPPPGSLRPEGRLATVVAVSHDSAAAPPECACCGRLATRSLRTARWGGRGIAVPYCTDCHMHASRDETRELAVTLASILLAVTSLASIPLVWQPPSALPFALIVLALGFAPGAIARVAGRRAERGHASAGRAVFVRWDGAFVCRSVAWGDRLAALHSATAGRTRAWDPALSRWGAAVILVGGLAAFPFFAFHFPEVRVVNVTGERLALFVDGRLRSLVPETSAESPTAGVVLRIPSGRRRLRAKGPSGNVVDDASVVVHGGEPHLYAPASAGTCFWVESRGYGKRARGDLPPDVLLGGEPRFWVVPSGVDYWFSEPPEEGADERSTGGVLRALRQARCEDVPKVRSGRSPFATDGASR